MLKYCTFCQIEHPVTTEYWTIRKTTGRPNQCRERVRYNSKEYTKKSKAKRYEWHQKYKETPNGRFYRARIKAKKRKIEWQLNLDQYIQLVKNNCYYCKDTLSKSAGNLDRVDNFKGYELNNVVPCCINCNVAKGTKTTEEFAQWILRAAKWAEEVVS